MEPVRPSVAAAVRTDSERKGGGAAGAFPPGMGTRPEVGRSITSITSGAENAQASTLWARAARDPLVQRVKEAVEGTLLDVRPAGDAATVSRDADGATVGAVTEELTNESDEIDQPLAGVE